MTPEQIRSFLLSIISQANDLIGLLDGGKFPNRVDVPSLEDVVASIRVADNALDDALEMAKGN